MSFNPFDLITPSAEELHDLEVHEALGERDARIERLKSLLEQAEAERDGYRAAAADLRDELAEANSRAAYLGDDAAAERSSRLWLARAVKVLGVRARDVLNAKTDLEKLMAASNLVVEVTQLAKASHSLCFEAVDGEVTT